MDKDKVDDNEELRYEVDEIKINTTDNEPDDETTSDREHLKPRVKIVKKQLKNYDDELSNDVEDTVESEESQKMETKANVITFVADPSTDDYFSRRDLWSRKSSSADRIQLKADASALPKDYIMSIFRNKTTTNVNNPAPNAISFKSVSKYKSDKQSIDNYYNYHPTLKKPAENVAEKTKKDQNDNIFYAYVNRNTNVPTPNNVKTMAPGLAKPIKSNQRLQSSPVMLIYETIAVNKTVTAVAKNSNEPNEYSSVSKIETPPQPWTEASSSSSNEAHPRSVCDNNFNCKLPKCFCSGTKIPSKLCTNHPNGNHNIQMFLV